MTRGGLEPGGYSGPDRRGPAHDQPGARTWPAGTVAVSAVLGSSAVAVTLADPSLTASPAAQAFASAAAVVAPLVGAVAGATWCAAWSVSGLRRYGVIGVALLALSVLAPAARVLGPTLHADAYQQTSSPVTRLAVVAAACALLLAALRRPDVDTRTSPARLFSVAAVSVAASVGLLAFVVAAGLSPAVSRGAGVTADAVSAALGLLVLLAYAGRRGAPTCGGRGLFLAALVAWSAGSGLRVPAALAPDHTWGVSSSVCMLLGTLLLFASGADTLSQAIGARRGRDKALRRRFAQVVVSSQRELARAADLRHDLRNLAAGLSSATWTLTTRRSGLRAEERELLESAVQAELARLHRLVDEETERPSSFRVDDALRAVITAERALGARVTTELAVVRAWGSPGVLAAIVQNLLTNARLHAPGAPVRVGAAQDGENVRMWVHDAGPGIPADHRGLAATRGHRGPTVAPGSGLGLAICARLAREQGGSLCIESGEDGTRVQLTLPAAERLQQGTQALHA